MYSLINKIVYFSISLDVTQSY